MSPLDKLEFNILETLVEPPKSSPALSKKDLFESGLPAILAIEYPVEFTAQLFDPNPEPPLLPLSSDGV